jgi:[acyl-carrier-protein] S-malonyltransferase
MLAFTFPGQGSQRPGMGLPWRAHESWELVDEASEIAGRDVAQLLCDAGADELRDTRNAQLTTFVSSLMVLDAVERLGVEPSFCAGHSLGEYTALTATGALGFDDGVRLVVARAAAMHDAGNAQPGTMAAVLGLDDDQVEIACRRAEPWESVTRRDWTERSPIFTYPRRRSRRH